MFHQVVPAIALAPDVAGPPLISPSVPSPTSMSVYSEGPDSALHGKAKVPREWVGGWFDAAAALVYVVLTNVRRSHPCWVPAQRRPATLPWSCAPVQVGVSVLHAAF